MTLHVTTSEALEKEDVMRIYGTARRIDPQLGEFLRILEVPSLEHSIAGKTPMVLFKDRPYSVGDSERP